MLTDDDYDDEWDDEDYGPCICGGSGVIVVCVDDICRGWEEAK